MRSDAKTDLKSTLINQIENKLDQSNSQRKMRVIEAEESVKKLQGYQQYLEEVKNQKNYGQQLYKEILDKQQREREESLRANRMTKQEKKLNQLDLQAYKQSDYQLHSLIPGLQHSKHDFNGSPALKRVANSTLISPNRSLMAESSGKVSKGNTETLREPAETSSDNLHSMTNEANENNMLTPKSKFLMPSSMRGVIASPTYITSTNNALSMQINNKYSSPLAMISGRKTQDPIKENIFYRPPPPQNNFALAMNSQASISDPIKKTELPAINATANLGSPKATSFVPIAKASLHNPIINPMPHTTQNPYILKQLRSFPNLSSERNVQATSFG
eukprot:CAMPEP_0176409540 /NCGR_PEP_ID=MMETSP0127-20121128/2555_1 /TAXON_ID=938130 /ORGANISM="Platyophrya macrostoma, Strain WH" /LENGTH=331 /DNA_ID=CAMNT_0017788931 /DNA_START=134 /DNA_END=1129 /DNA_ORIENTATION=-